MLKGKLQLRSALKPERSCSTLDVTKAGVGCSLDIPRIKSPGSAVDSHLTCTRLSYGYTLRSSLSVATAHGVSQKWGGKKVVGLRTAVEVECVAEMNEIKSYQFSCS